MTIALNRLGALEASRLLQRREITAVQLLRACFARIEQRDGQLHAWTAIDQAAAMARAEALDRGAITGPLHGLPFGVKDMFDTASLPTRYGSAIYKDHQPAHDAAAVAQCVAAGAIIAGKTVTTEFATYKPPPTRNPHGTAYSPGGSSSGSAAAVADNMVPFALGTQTAASIVRPAAYCGVVGYKPTFAVVPREGLKSLARSLDTIGWFARSVPDTALVASVLLDEPRLTDLSSSAAPRIGMYRSPQWRRALPETRAALDHAASVFSRAGAAVEEIPLPQEYCSLVQLQSDVMAYEVAQSLEAERREHANQLSTSLLALLEAGATISPAQHAANLQRAAQTYDRVQGWFDRYDVLLSPSATGEAPLAELGTGDPLFGRVWTMLGTPCVHLPFATGPQGLPVGLQAIGRRGDDHKLLAMAHWMHERLLAASEQA